MRSAPIAAVARRTALATALAIALGALLASGWSTSAAAWPRDAGPTAAPAEASRAASEPVATAQSSSATGAGAPRPAAAASDPVTLAIGQGFGAPPDITLALDLVDEEGRAPATLDPQAIAATIGSHAATVLRVTPFEATHDGIAYIFLVDVSRSLSASEMIRVREALRLWASSSRPADRLALIAFGDDVSTLVDFTTDRAAFQQAVDTLAPRARTTQLHTAIERAVALSRRQDAGLPSRRVAVLLSDGQDEGSGLTADDVAALLRQDRLPIYAIGYSLQGESRARGLESLRRLARNSGGLFREVGAASAAGAGASNASRASNPSHASNASGAATVSRATISDIYQAMQRAVTRVFSVTLRCDACVGDGQLHRLQVQVKTGTRVLSDGIDLRLPVSSSTRTPTPSTTTARTSTATPAGTSTATTAPTPVRSPAMSPRLVAGIAAASVAVVAVAIAIVWRMRRRRSHGTGSHATGSHAADHNARGSGAEHSAPEVPEAIAVTCYFRGRYAAAPQTITLRDRATVGADTSTCAVVIPDDDEVAAAHCELAWDAGYVTLRRLDARHPTLVNGAAVSPASTYRLESGDIVLLGRTEFRVMFEEAVS